MNGAAGTLQSEGEEGRLTENRVGFADGADEVCDVFDRRSDVKRWGSEKGTIPLNVFAIQNPHNRRRSLFRLRIVIWNGEWHGGVR